MSPPETATGFSPNERTIFGFVPQFWVINFIELLERAAFYGALSFIALYLDSLGYAGTTLGLLLAMALTMPYIISVLSGPLAEKYGYQPMTIASFIGYTAGYIVLAYIEGTPAIVGGLALVGLGSGLFKAIPAACITHLTPEKKRNLGFVLYYWAINIGAFATPLIIGYAIFGADATPAEYRVGFLTVAGASVAALVMSLFVFRNPKQPNHDVSVGRSFIPLLQGFTDVRFVIPMLLHSGFFAVYAMNFTFMPLYLDNFVALPSWFPVFVQQSLNPLVIILLAVPLGAMLNKIESLRMMSFGYILFIGGFLIIGFSGTFWGWALGIFFAAIGEFLAQPGFLAYVSKVAPKDRVAVYQSLGFLPIAVGYFLGPILGGVLYDTFAVEQGRVPMFWAIVTSIGLIPLAGFLLLAAKARESDGGRAVTRKERGIAFTPIPAIAVVVLIGFALGAPEPLDEDAAIAAEIDPDLGSFSGNLAEGESFMQVIQVPAGTGTVSFALKWQDEPPSAGGGLLPAAQNQPDRFSLRISAPVDGQQGGIDSETSDASGNIIEDYFHNGPAREVTVVVTMVDAGDETVAGQTVAADNGNDYELVVGFQST